MDRDTYAVLETIQSLEGTPDDIQSGWFLSITVAARTGETALNVRDEIDILAEDDLIEIKRLPDRNRLGDLFCLSTKGRAVLARGRKQRRLTESQASQARLGKMRSADNVAIIVSSKSAEFAYDVFISYASEDEARAKALQASLATVGVSVWFAPTELRMGDQIVEAIEQATRVSRHAILLLSAAYIRKPYPRMEFDAFVKRQIETRTNVILPILLGISQEQVSHFSVTLGGIRNIDGISQSNEQLVDEILRVVRPPIVTTSNSFGTGAALTSDKSQQKPLNDPERRSGEPFDALHDDIRLLAFRPRLNIAFSIPEERDGAVFIDYTINNIGAGAASKIFLFLSGLVVDSIERPLSPNAAIQRTIRYDDRMAYNEIIGSSGQGIAEFEDLAGNLYRQYGLVIQPHLNAPYFGYGIGELERPYLVPQRIVEADPGHDRFKRARRP